MRKTLTRLALAGAATTLLAGAALAQVPAPPAPPAPPPRLDGIVSPSRSAPTLFLDGQAHPAKPQQIHLGSSTADVRSPDGRLHRLRVGDPPSAAAP